MKSIPITDLHTLKNELNRYRKGKKLDINQFNQAARLAWLGKATLQPLDPTDPECKSYLLYLDHPDGLAQHIVDIDEDLVGRMHILDGEQGDVLAQIVEQGVNERAGLYRELSRKDFYFDKFYNKSSTPSAG